MPRAVILGGTGVIGRAIARRLLSAQWEVELMARNASRMPADIRDGGGRFVAGDRRDPRALARSVGGGADLLVDAVCYTAADATLLLPYLRAVRTVVMVSSKAVYVDDDGNHSNSVAAPRFPVPVREDQATLPPDSTGDYNSPDGYGRNKVAAEQVLLESGFPVTVLRPSKVHGESASRPREWMFVKRVIDGRRQVLLAHRGEGIDHTTAAANVAALVERVAHLPGQRVLNSADPDAPSGLEIAQTVARHFNHGWETVLLGEDAPAGLGAHPWDARPPIVLDTSASLALGYKPAGSYAETVGAELEWLREQALAGRGPEDEAFFGRFLDYAAEDRFLQARG